jgi:hypothetical protein
LFNTLLTAKQAVEIKLRATDINKKSDDPHTSVDNRFIACVRITPKEHKPNTKPINLIILNLLVYLTFYDVSLRLPQKISIELCQ